MPIALDDLRAETGRGPSRAWTHYYRKDNGRQVCGSRMKRKPETIRCGRTDIGPNGRCRGHGKDSGRPPVTGLYAQSFGVLRESCIAAMESRALLDSSERIAALDVIAAERLRRAIEEGDTPNFRREAHALWQAAAGGQHPQAFSQLGELLEKGVEQDRAAAEAAHLIDKVANRAQREVEVKTKQERTFTEANVILLMELIFATIRREAPANVSPVLERAIYTALQASPSTISHSMPELVEAESVNRTG